MAKEIGVRIKLDTEGLNETAKLENALRQLRKEKQEFNKRTKDSKELTEEEAKELAELNIAIQKNSTALRNQRKQAEQTDDSLEGMRKRLSQLKIQYAQLSKADREGEIGKNLRKDLNDLNNEVSEIEQGFGVFSRNVGNYKSAFNGLGNVIKGAFGGLLAGAGLLEVGSRVREIGKELETVSRRIEQLSGVTGQANKELSSLVLSIQQTYGEDTQEILRAANTLSNEFGITQEEALNKINLGFATGLNNSGEFLDILREYPAQLKAVGLTADQTFNLIEQQVEQGVYSDKGIDAIKEAGLRLRELPKATREALEGIGLSSVEIEKALRSGEASIFDVVQQVSSKLQTLPETSTEVGTAIADIFGSAGEDAGLSFITSLADVTDGFSAESTVFTELEKAQLRLQEQNEELLNNFQDLFGDVGLGLTNLKASFLEFSNTVLNAFINNLDSIKQFARIIGTLITSFVSYRAVVFSVNKATQLYKFATASARSVTLLFSKGLRVATTSFKGLDKAMKSNIIGLVTSLVATLVAELVFFRDKTDEATESQKEFNKSQQDLLEQQKDINRKFAIRNKLSVDGIKRLITEIENLIDTQEKEEENLIANIEATEKQNEERVKGLQETQKEVEKLGSAQRGLYDEQAQAQNNSQLALNLQKAVIESSNEQLKLDKSRIVEVKADLELRKSQLSQLQQFLKLKEKENQLNLDNENKIGLIADLEEKIKNARQNQKDAVTEEEIKRQGELINGYEKELNRLRNIGKEKEKQKDLQDELVRLNNELYIKDTDNLQEQERRKLEIQRQNDIARLSQMKDVSKEERKLAIQLVNQKFDAENNELAKRFAKQQEEDKIKQQEQFLSDKKERQEQIVQSTLEINNLLANIEQNAIQQRSQRQIRELEDRFQANIISVEQFEKAKIDIQREAARREQQVAIRTAVINNALAVTKALSSAGFPLNFIQAGIVAARGIAEIASIRSQQFADGGVLSGPSHAQGGIPFTIGGQAGFEAEGGEAIINKKSTSMFAPLLSAINEAGGGTAFAKGGQLPQPKMRFQSGGVAQPVSGAGLNEQSIVRGIVQAMPMLKVVNVATETSDEVGKVTNIQNEATF